MRWARIQTICPPYQSLLTSFPDRNRRTRYRPIQSRDDCCTCQAFCFISKRLRMSLATPQDPFRRPLSRRSKSCRCHSFPFVYSQSGLSFRIQLSWIVSVFIRLRDTCLPSGHGWPISLHCFSCEWKALVEVLKISCVGEIFHFWVIWHQVQSVMQTNKLLFNNYNLSAY